MALPAEKELEEVIVPDGGIADFIISDEDYDELARQEASKTFGESGGIAEFQEQAARMAQYGRGGDQFVAHLAPGEIVVPAPLIENNPELRDSIFGHLREMGIENPEQYVVGASANSINPETGLMEFGFLSKVFKGVKKVVKGVGKVLKKAAPIILPIVGTAVLGPVWGAALGSGIATLINGGSLKDAALSAAMSGGIGAVTAGFGGPAGSSFGENVSRAMDAGSYLNTVGARVGQTLDTKTFFERGSVFSAPTADQLGAAAQPGMVDQTIAAAGTPTSVDPTIAAAGTPPTVVADTSENPFVNAMSRGIDNARATTVAAPKVPSVMQTGTYQPNVAEILGGQGSIPLGGQNLASTGGGIYPTLPDLPSQPSFVDRSFNAVQDYGTRLVEEPLTTLGDTFFPSGPTAKEIVQSPDYAALLAKNVSPDVALKTLQSQMSPGLIRSYLPLVTAGTLGAAALGVFDNPEVEESPLGLQRGPTGADLLAADVAAGGTKYTLPRSALETAYAAGPTTVASAYELPESPQVASLQEYLRQQRERLQNPFGPMRAAAGGEVYPRRTGGIMPYEGTPNEDSVRALLMPGEFVLTKYAVKGAGNGDLNRGINNMYGIMRGLEKRGRAMS